jgi:hypothetical protein
MPGYTANTCDIVTLFPLGVECVVTNATNPLTYDGYIGLIITGGTSPYSTKWSNGSQNNFLTGVQAGTYSATTVDYYGDYTANTVCQVGINNYFVEKFTDCSNPSSSVFYLADFENQVQTGKTYTISGQLGCWISNGIELYSAGTFFDNNVNILSGPFVNCTECLPTTPELENTSGLCLNYNYLSIPEGLISNSYQFYSASTINGYPSWTSNTKTIYYNTTSSKWLVSGWTDPGLPQLVSTLSPPIGNWEYNGVSGEAIVLQGNCQDAFTITTNQSNPTCINSLNGSIVITSVQGGTPPYLYALSDESNYQSSNIFSGLDDGPYLIYVKDIIGNVSTKTVTLNPQQPVTNYQVNIIFSPSNPQQTIGSNFSQINLQYEVNVTPPLPAGKTLTFDLLHTTTISAGTATDGSPLIIYTNTTGTTGGGQYLTSSQNIVTQNLTTISCHPNYYTSAITRTYSSQIVGSGTVGGTVFKKVQVSNSQQCSIVGFIVDNFSIVNVQLINQNSCETLNTSSNQITNTINRAGLLTVSGQGDQQLG